MSARLKSEIWISAWLRRCAAENVPAFLRRRGSAEAGAIFLKIDLLDGTSALYGPALQGDYQQNHADRLFRRLHEPLSLPSYEVEALMESELRFDRDLWFLEAEDRQGRIFADVATA